MSFMGRVVMFIFVASFGLLIINNIGQLDAIINSISRVATNEFRILSGQPAAGVV